MNKTITNLRRRTALIVAPSDLKAILDEAKWDFVWTCEKWSEDAVEYARRHLDIRPGFAVSSAQLRGLMAPDLGIHVIEANLLVNAGIQRMEDNLITVPASTAVFDNTHARMGTGDSATAATAADTDLGAAAGSTHRQFKVMNATFPSRASQTVTWQSDFTSGEANYHWQEWCIDNGTSNGTTVSAPMLNHKVEDLGTKTTGTWTLSGAVTVS